MLADDGKCKTFDSRANGYVRGEGSGAILIKPLEDAIAHGDHIYAVVKSTAENHGGKATMLTAPNPNAQADLPWLPVILRSLRHGGRAVGGKIQQQADYASQPCGNRRCVGQHGGHPQ